MSVVGFDIGHSSSIIGVARAGGIEIVANEYSYRVNPTIVGFGAKRRAIGETGKTQLATNYKNTITNIKNIVGRDAKDANDETISAELEALLCRHIVTEEGIVEFMVKRNGNEEKYADVQVLAAYLSQLKQTAETFLQRAVKDCVISVPNFFNNRQRAAMMDATVILGLNCLRLINDTTASALQYGIYKQDLPTPEEKPRVVAIVDCGHSSTKACIVSLVQQNLTIVSSAAVGDVGGRDFDKLLHDHFAVEFKEKYKIDVTTNPKASLRLTTACEELKKVMSSVTNACPMNIECLMNDKDVKGLMKREDFEVLAAPLLNKIEPMLTKLVMDAGVNVDDIHSVEIVGGMSRVPAIKDIIKEVFNKEPCTTLNADESGARGCSLACAILSPAFRVREFKVTDIVPYGITIEYDEEGVQTLEAYQVNSPVGPQGSLKAITFKNTEAFEIRVRYTHPDRVAFKQNEIARYVIPKQTTRDGSIPKIKVKFRLDANGVFVLENANLIEEIAVEEGDEKKDTDMEGESKTKQIRTPITFEFKTNNLSPELIAKYVAIETEQQRLDKLVQVTEQARNKVEEYVYECRDNLDGKWGDFVEEAAKEKFQSELTSAEDWLYEDGEDCEKSVYEAKFDELNGVGAPIAERFVEAEQRPDAISALRVEIVAYRKVVDLYAAKDEKYDHLDEDDMQKVSDLVASTDAWMNESEAKQNALPKFQVPTLRVAEINSKRELLTRTCRPIVTKAKPPPKVEVPHPDGAPADVPHPDGPQPPKTEEPAAEETAGAADGAAPEGEAMDLD